MASTSNSSTFSSSSSSPVETPQNQWQLALSQMLSGLGQQQLGWAQQQFGKAQGVTDDNIRRYIQQADLARSQGQNLWDRYTGTFQPLENQLVQDAGTYASTARTQQNMGLAESDVGQSMDQGKRNAEQTLQSFGIDPSSGRYAELEQAAGAQRAAAQAGAGTQAALATQDIGRQLRGQAIAIGQQLPGESVNSINAGLGAISGAENSILGLENTGANLMHTADPYFSDAMRIQNPPMQTTQSSRSTTTQNGSQPGVVNTGGGGGSQPIPPYQDTSGGGGGGGGGQQPGSPGRGPSAAAPGGGGAKVYTGLGGGGGGGDGSDGLGYSGVGTDYPLDPGSGVGFQDPYSNGYGNFDSNGGYSGDNYSAYTSPDQSYGFNPQQDQMPGDTSGVNFPDPSTSDYSMGSYADPSLQPSGSSDWSTNPGNIDITNFAGGGAVPTTGGHVPQNASPSRGVVQDDIPARLNANEYVIPRDVVRHKGTEFFNNLIKKSRAATGQPQRPIGAQSKPALPNQGQPRFVSRPGVI